MRSLKPLPPQDVLKRLLDYDVETGRLRWKARPEAGRGWPRSREGKYLRGAVTPDGYRQGRVGVGRTVFRYHRVIWKWFHGTDPEFIDHINGDRSDNRIENLRSVTPDENQRNAARRKDNRSGVTGVGWNKAMGKWIARITYEKKPIFLGYFDTLEAAQAARTSAAERLGFHKNHGRKGAIK